MYLIKNARVIEKENETKIVDILIEDGKIVRIADLIAVDCDTYDAQEQLVIAGGIDVHAHLREPGYTHKETIKTGSMAAAHGGYTTIMAMPNVIPYPDNVETMKQYLAKIKQDAFVNVIPYACITKQEAGHEIVDMKALKQLGIYAFSDDGVGVQQVDMMLEAMKKAKENDVMIVAHTEDMHYRKPRACVHEGKQNKIKGWIGIPSECEYKQIERDLKLALETGAKYHICHMSAKESVDLLRKYKQLGADVSGEVTTHHLLLSENDVETTNHKMNPPLRANEDRAALIEGLLDGTIDFIANDHAPHSEEEKNNAMDKAPFGIVALETSIPLIYTNFVKKKRMTLEQFQDVIATKPAKRFHFTNKGKLAEGYDADIVVLSDEVKLIDKDQFVSMGKNTPFHQVACQGFAIMSMVNGKIVYCENKGEKA
ncbi:MAG: dihydroorotase [Erysipelotrichia bacterium]|nr:dihydroorotase [Erysipelotrichia bacterium]NCC54173.1 dihydroorotase [Erysipelotrichia bacterium]